MNTLDLDNLSLTHLVTHHIGNSSREEGMRLSSKGSRIKQVAFDHLVEYFMVNFKPEEFFNFSHPEDLAMNEVFGVVKELMEREIDFVEGSQSLAKLLYEAAHHPKVQAGQFHVARLEGLILDGEELDAIGIFKSETTVPFLKMLSGDESYDIEAEQGIEIKGLDKGCLVFDTDKEKGYRALVYNANRSVDARYWNDEFLQLRQCNDEYHQTKEIMHITKEFVTKKMGQEFEVDKTEQIDLLNRSVAYFKDSQEFDKQEFAETVLQDENVIKSFDSFDEGYRQEYSLEPVQSFEISDQAVKKQSKVFKSVLKLDKNFHIYIHGDKSLIEKGEESDGRRFYKIYYDQES